ncbi:uncharacterized protein LOC109532896 isoform X1 [Dendroctonus ponderosae]|nr:uncharacterized protein LOC109532896 isoform X1 [Dendroctonus ponderosae]KAH1015186.1 hypothetical protein HUJ05_012954 [Dendroctonus ponderosae]KAH1015188.1 hypothetical protein HUJ05_012956 [Dendroctonus ponderosae]
MEMGRSKNNYSTRGRERSSRNYRGGRSRGYRPRGRPAFRRHHNDIGRRFRWERSQSPVEGSEEFMDRKIRNTSAIIMRHLFDGNDNCPVSTNIIDSTEDRTQIDTVDKNIKSSGRANSAKPPTKTNKTSNANLTAEQIYEKIMNHITNLNDGRKKNFIYTNSSSGLNQAVTDIQKQNRLEISRILRDMSSLTDRKDPEYHDTSIVPDIGIKIEELPENVIEELKRCLNVDLLSLNEAIEEPTASSPSCPIRPLLDVTSSSIDNAPFNVSAEPNAGVDSIEIKRECLDEADDNIVLNRQCDVETHCPDQSLQSQTGDLMNNRCSSENRNFELDIKVEEGYDLADSPLDIKDEAQLNDDSPMWMSNSLDTTVEFANQVTDGIVNNLNNREEEEADNTNSPAVVSTGIVSDNGESDYILQNLENTIFQNLASDRKSKCTDIEKVIIKMELIDGCMQHLTTYRRYLMQTVLSLSKRNYSTPHNHCEASQMHNLSSPSTTPTSTPPTATKTASLIDSDQRIIKRRKTTVDEQICDISLDTDSEAEAKLEKHTESPIHLRLEHKILCIEKVDENYLLLATDAGNIVYVTLHDSCLKYTLDVTQTPITSMQFVKSLNDFIYMYVGCLDTVLRICDFRGRKILQGIPICDEIMCMDYMWDYLFMGCRNGSLIRFSSKKFRVEFEEKNTGSDILVVKAAQEGPRRILLVGHRNAPIYVRDAMSGLCLRNFSNEAIVPTVYSIIIKGSSLYCGTAKDNILVFSFHEGKLINSIIADRAKGISCMKIKYNRLYVGCYNGSIYIYDLDGIKLITKLYGPGGSIQCMAVLDTQIVVGTLSGKFASLSWHSKTP